jgi:hypothetical protein
MCRNLYAVLILYGCTTKYDEMREEIHVTHVAK